MSLRLYPGAMSRLLSGPEIAEALEAEGQKVVNRARRNAAPIAHGDRVKAIRYETGKDAAGPFVDVGYSKSHYGFVLWWHEVGTSRIPPHPHLRPAARRS